MNILRKSNAVVFVLSAAFILSSATAQQVNDPEQPSEVIEGVADKARGEGAR